MVSGCNEKVLHCWPQFDEASAAAAATAATAAAASKNVLQVENPPLRKNSSDALRTAVEQSKAALKKGLKIGSTGLSGLRRHAQTSNPEMEHNASERVIEL